MNTNAEKLINLYAEFLDEAIDLASGCLKQDEDFYKTKDRDFYEGVHHAYCVALAMFNQVFAESDLGGVSVECSNC